MSYAILRLCKKGGLDKEYKIVFVKRRFFFFFIFIFWNTVSLLFSRKAYDATLALIYSSSGGETEVVMKKLTYLLRAEMVMTDVQPALYLCFCLTEPMVATDIMAFFVAMFSMVKRVLSCRAMSERQLDSGENQHHNKKMENAINCFVSSSLNVETVFVVLKGIVAASKFSSNNLSRLTYRQNNHRLTLAIEDNEMNSKTDGSKHDWLILMECLDTTACQDTIIQKEKNGDTTLIIKSIKITNVEDWEVNHKFKESAPIEIEELPVKRKPSDNFGSFGSYGNQSTAATESDLRSTLLHSSVAEA